LSKRPRDRQHRGKKQNKIVVSLRDDRASSRDY
jgi:hypothetical protein